MSSPPPDATLPPASARAVFLSYASQDADAARRICETLRTAGIEVWFDQNELVGGDAWDAKIRKQIADCALFVPIISAATQARGEGYFRIEWRLAAQRTHGMADDTTFLLPIVIDDTRDSDARVPAEFKAVQWTRLPAGEPLEKTCLRVRALLGGSPMGMGRPFPAHSAEVIAATKKPRLPVPLLALGAVVIGVAVVALYFALRPRRSPGEIAKPMAIAPPAAANVTAKVNDPPASEAGQLLARARALIDKPSYTRANLAAAEELTRKATEISAGSADAWAERAYVNAGYVTGGWDSSIQRRHDAQDFARRALAFDSNQVEALRRWARCSRSRARRQKPRSLSAAPSSYGPTIRACGGRWAPP